MLQVRGLDHVVLVVDGPVARKGARDVATSLYVLGPDDNVVELRYDP